MPFTYSILCTNPSCQQPAQFKIAARWTDGITEELKTYGLTCENCLPEAFLRSLEKQKSCRLAQGEILETPCIYELVQGKTDWELHRLPEWEEKILQSQ